VAADFCDGCELVMMGDTILKELEIKVISLVDFPLMSEFIRTFMGTL
jgi:hypothetical protein